VHRYSSLRRLGCSFAATVLFAASLSAQAPASTPAPMPMSEEGHHHLVSENSYVRVFFVEIPAHETTLLHYHDLPYISVPPGGYELGSQAESGPTSVTNFARVAYAAGKFSHAVTNSGDRPLRNVAVELVRPQGMTRNRCAIVVRDLPQQMCDVPELTSADPSRRLPLFESDEVLVESWEVGPGATTAPLDDRLDMLIAGLTDVRISGNSGIDSANALRGGELWIPAGSKPVFRTAPDRGGHFVTISFKDSVPGSQ
jgi:hypothetical protein